MQGKLERGKAAFHARSIGSLAILAGAPLIAVLALGAPERALAACGASSHPAGVHAAAGGGGGGGTLGCAGGSSASALRGLPTTSSGRVVEPGAHASRTATHAGNAATRTANAGVHMHAVGHAHRI